MKTVNALSSNAHDLITIGAVKTQLEDASLEADRVPNALHSGFPNSLIKLRQRP